MLSAMQRSYKNFYDTRMFLEWDVMELTYEEGCQITGENKINLMEQGFESIGLASKSALKILDVGGTKYTFSVFSRMFPNSKITTMNILKAESDGCPNFISGNAENFRLNQKFDVIVANDLIEHLFNPDAFFNCCHSHLAPGGILVITTPNIACWYNRLFLLMGYSLANYSAGKYRTGNPMLRQFANEHKSVFNVKGLKDLLSIYKFDVVYSKGYTYTSRRHESAGKDGKYYSIRRALDCVLPSGLKEGILVIARKRDG